MRILVASLVAVAALGSAQTASAADLPVKAAPLVVASVYNWTGVYVGGTFGYAWGSSQHCDPPGSGFCTASFNVNGVTGGGTLGYNRQINNWVVGIETDFSFSNAKGSTVTVPGVFGCGANPQCLTNLNWFGTLRGRVGPTFNAWFPYVTGGFAYGELKAALGAPPLTTSATATKTGWTVGGGVEYAITPQHWSVKAEYLYIRLGNLFYDTGGICGNLNCTAVHNKFSVVRLGVNYRF